MSTTASPAERDLHEAEHIRRHHGHLVAELDRLSDQLASHPSEGAREELSHFLTDSLLPHAAGEERSIYQAASRLEAGQALVEALVREHVLIRGAVTHFNEADMDDARIWGLAIADTFRSHQAKEDDIVVPMLLAAPGFPSPMPTAPTEPIRRRVATVRGTSGRAGAAVRRAGLAGARRPGAVPDGG